MLLPHGGNQSAPRGHGGVGAANKVPQGLQCRLSHGRARGGLQSGVAPVDGR